MTPAKGLVGMWVFAVRLNGGTLRKAVADLNAISGRRYTYKRLHDWKAGKRPVPRAAREAMLKMAMPYILRCVGVRLTKQMYDDLVEMLT